MKSHEKLNYHCQPPVLGCYDVIVCGGGPSGIPAALAARRAGASVLLIEQTGQLGGTGTSAGVSHLLGGRTADNRHACVDGIFAEIVNDLVARGGAVDPRTIADEKYPPYGWCKGLDAGVPFDPIAMVALLDEKMVAAGVDVLYFTSVVDVIVKDQTVSHVICLLYTSDAADE